MLYFGVLSLTQWLCCKVIGLKEAKTYGPAHTQAHHTWQARMEGLTSPPPLPPLPSTIHTHPHAHKSYLLDRRRRIGGKGCQGLGGAIAVDFLGQVRGLGLEGGLVVVEDDGAAVRHDFVVVFGCVWCVGGCGSESEQSIRNEKKLVRDAPRQEVTDTSTATQHMARKVSQKICRMMLLVPKGQQSLVRVQNR